MKHIADKRTSEWLRAYPAALEQAEDFRVDRADFGELWPDWCGLPMAATYAIITGGVDQISATRIMRDRIEDLPRLTAALLWRQAKAVYRPDKTLVEELDVEDDMQAEIPADVLKLMPYYCIYIEHPFELTPGKTALGCFVWLEADHREPGTVELRLLYLLANNNIASVPLKLSGKTLGESLSLISPIERIQFAAMLRAVRQTVSIALYICSDAADVRTDTTVQAVPREQRTFKANPDAPTVWEIGARVGAAIRAYRRSPVQTAENTGSHASPRPHMRRAHWHSFWTGPRDGDRKLVIRWLPPIPVNYEATTELPAVIHIVSKKEGNNHAD